MFKKLHTIKTKLSKEESITILQSKVENFHRDNSNYSFEGKIDLSGDLCIMPTFDYAPRNQFRPNIIGKINSNEINFVFELSFIMKKILWFIVLVEPVIIGFIYNKFQEKTVLLFFPFLIVFLLILKYIFDNKVQKSITLLESYFK